METQEKNSNSRKNIHFLAFLGQKEKTVTHCHAEGKQIIMWQKGLAGQYWAALTLNFNLHYLIQ